jgi:hypothetical protein
MPKALIVTGCVLLILVVTVLVGWKLGYITFYSYTLK